MTGINQGRPETAIGEPIRLGNDLDYELEHHPASDRLIIRDTANGTVAYVRADAGEEIGGDDVLVEGLKKGEPVADDGRTYSTIQEAERAASSWVFVPPGTFNENVSIDTAGLTIQGSGYNSQTNNVDIKENDVSLHNISVSKVNALAKSDVKNISISSTYVRTDGIDLLGKDHTVVGCRVSFNDRPGVQVRDKSVVSSCILTGPNSSVGNSRGVMARGNCIVVNNISIDAGQRGIQTDDDNNIVVGNRVINSYDDGIGVYNGANNIVANNRVSDSTENDIQVTTTNSINEGNLTGPSN